MSDINEKLDPSMGAGKYVKDFRKSDAPQFEGKSDKKKQKMAIAAFLGDLRDKSESKKESYISDSMSDLRARIKGMDIDTSKNEEVQEEKTTEPRFSGTELADRTLDTYKSRVKVEEEKKENKEPVTKPETKASRELRNATVRALTGMRGPGASGDEGKTSRVGPGGSGNVSSAGGNVVIPPLSMEEYKEKVATAFDEACWKGYEKKGMKTMFGKRYPNCVKKEEVQPEIIEEDIVSDLEQELLKLEDTSWISIDKVMRRLCKENDMTPKELHKEFKAKHGMIPDAWVKEQNTVEEQVGWFPLDEVVHYNKVGRVYDVTFLYRGGTQRFKFFWPQTGQPSKEQMEYAVRGFYPMARLVAFYPSLQQDGNHPMVIVPPMSEHFEVFEEEDWGLMSEEATEIFNIICEEEGEPLTSVWINEDDNYEVLISDHDTGEEKLVTFSEEGLRDWFGKSKSKDGKKGWVNVVTGDSCASDKPGEGIPKCVSSAKRASMSEKERKAAAAAKRREDPGQQKKSGAASPTNVKTDRKVKEEFELEEAADKKGKGSGTKDACYNKVKSRYSVWPSAYASGALVKCRKVGAANWGNKSEEFVSEGKGMEGMTQKGGHKRSTESGAGLTQKGVEKYRRQNPGSKLQTAVTTPPSKLKPGSKAANRRKSFCARSKGWTGERGKAARRRWNC